MEKIKSRTIPDFLSEFAEKLTLWIAMNYSEGYCEVLFQPGFSPIYLIGILRVCIDDANFYVMVDCYDGDGLDIQVYTGHRRDEIDFDYEGFIKKFDDEFLEQVLCDENEEAV